MILLLIIVLLLLSLGGLPNLGIYNHGYGYGPLGVLGTVLIVVLILFLFGRL